MLCQVAGKGGNVGMCESVCKGHEWAEGGMDEQEGGGTRQQERHLKLVAKREPVLLHVVLPPEDLQLAGTRRKPLDESIDFVRLVAGVANLQAEKKRIKVVLPLGTKEYASCDMASPHCKYVSRDAVLVTYNHGQRHGHSTAATRIREGCCCQKSSKPGLTPLTHTPRPPTHRSPGRG